VSELASEPSLLSAQVDDSSPGGEPLNRLVGGTRRLGEQTAFYGNALAATPDVAKI